MALPTVTIIGRINAGKSTLFNRLTETEKAITSPVPGTTRDRIYSRVQWQKIQFNLIDTGGVDIEQLKNSIELLRTKKWIKEPGLIEKEVIKQTQKALKEATLLLFVADGQAGLMKHDRDLAKILKRFQKPIVLACNKIDSPKWNDRVSDFFSLGLGEPIPVSAKNGSGTGDLLDRIVEELNKVQKNNWDLVEKGTELETIRVSFIGKPSVGKSSLLNAILGEERVITSPIPQTTREPQDIDIIYKDKKITLVDTAGLKKRRNTAPGLDSVSYKRSLDCIKKSDIVLFVLDLSTHSSGQDLRLSGTIENSTASAIIIANKWDLIQNKETISAQIATDYIKKMLPPLSWAPIIYTSAVYGKNVQKILDLILEVYERRKIASTDEALAKILKNILRMKKPYGGTGIEKPYITKIKQTRTNPPEFTLYLGKNQSLDETYLNYVKKTFRTQFDLEGVNFKTKIGN
ncbi:MAG: GTP-binding protein Der [Parcubacteria group bacterium GW2011_GWA2_38_13]|nr:MAG: GTP-binding protein Der [Parcubacteria group bacterium GW2011_GWA2_38_13]